MQLRTERLTLRPWSETDAVSLYALARHPEIGPAAGWCAHESISESRTVIEQVLKCAGNLAVTLTDTGELLGAISLVSPRQINASKPDEYELGFWIGRPFWGLGYIPEASEALIEFAFEEMDAPKVWCAYYDGNVKSLRVQSKLGFVYQSSDEVDVPLLGERRLRHIQVLERSAWEKRQK